MLIFGGGGGAPSLPGAGASVPSAIGCRCCEAAMMVVSGATLLLLLPLRAGATSILTGLAATCECLGMPARARAQAFYNTISG